MGFLKNVISGFSKAVKAGENFNPMLEGVTKKIEELHAQGHLDDVLFEAEQSYKKEHEEYLAKGTHTNAAESQEDSRALAHFMKALEGSKDKLDPSVQKSAGELLEMKGQMEHILGNAFKK